MTEKKIITANLIMLAIGLLLLVLINKSCNSLKLEGATPPLIEVEPEDTVSVKLDLPFTIGKLFETFDANAITFDSGKATISDDGTGKVELLKLAESLKLPEYSELGLKIEGYTDDVGNEVLNFKLSRERAQNIRDYLVNDGQIDPARLTYIGYGANMPKTNNTTNEGRAQNRRVELVFFPLNQQHGYQSVNAN